MVFVDVRGRGCVLSGFRVGGFGGGDAGVGVRAGHRRQRRRVGWDGKRSVVRDGIHGGAGADLRVLRGGW
jgi:hypothetical protein